MGLAFLRSVFFCFLVVLFLFCVMEVFVCLLFFGVYFWCFCCFNVILKLLLMLFEVVRVVFDILCISSLTVFY